ncbi:MAG: MBL fold metallo-hydrolase [Zavarzinella sp.]
MQITIHRGTNEIGGSCVEVATSTTRLVIDLGMPLVDANREPFDSSAASAKSIETLKAEKVIPGISGLFDTLFPAPEGILLSHAHLDHAGLLYLSRSAVPIYATSGTSKMMLAASVFAGQKRLDRTRFREVVGKQQIQIGDCRVTPLPVDHSIFGSVAFLVEGDGKTILYSGDFRKHGRKPGMIRDLLNYIKGIPVDVLIVEGTHFGSEKVEGATEYQLEESIFDMVKSAPALVLATFSALDVDRIVTLYKVAQKTDRIFVVDAYTAFVLYLISEHTKVPKPSRDMGIRVYFNKLFELRKLVTIRERFLADQIELSEILSDSTRYLMVFRPSMVQLDFNGQLPSRCRCLYGYWKGYLAKKDWVDLQHQIAQVHGDFIPAHVSGHAYVADIVSFVKSVNARTVIPIHTFEPQMFQNYFSNVTMLSDRVSFDVV